MKPPTRAIEYVALALFPVRTLIDVGPETLKSGATGGGAVPRSDSITAQKPGSSLPVRQCAKPATPGCFRTIRSVFDLYAEASWK